MTLYENDIHTSLLHKAFVTALLLSGSPELAEAAVFESIQGSSAHATDDELLGSVVAAGIRTRREHERHRPAGLEKAASLLPVELQGVLHLPTVLRQPFVLRFLLQLPREACVRLLHLAAEQVDEAACLAAETFARIAATQKAA